MGIRTPDLLHAMRNPSVDPSPAGSNGEPPTSSNALKPSGTVWQSVNTVAPQTGSPAPRAGEEPPMEIEITDDFMRLHDGGRTISTARRRADGWWEVSHWPRFFDRNQAITALTVTGLPEAGRDNTDPVVMALREELR